MTMARFLTRTSGTSLQHRLNVIFLSYDLLGSQLTK